MLEMHDEVIVATSPCKDNIKYRVFPFRSIAKTFAPILEMLKAEGPKSPRSITTGSMMSVLIHFKANLEVNFTSPARAPDKYCLVDMFMSCTDPIVKEKQ